MNNDFLSLVRRFGNDFHSWLRHSWKSLPNRLTRDKKIVIHGNSCIILYIICSDNGLLPGQCQAIIWTNAGISLIWNLGRNFSEILSEIHAFSFKKMHCKISSVKWWQFCLSLNVLNQIWDLIWNLEVAQTIGILSYRRHLPISTTSYLLTGQYWCPGSLHHQDISSCCFESKEQLLMSW